MLQEKIVEHNRAANIKGNVVFHGEYKKPVNDLEETKEINFKTKNYTILPTTDIEEYLKDVEGQLLAEMD